MTTALDYRAIFVEHQAFLRSIGAALARRHGLVREDQEDFVSELVLKVMVDDFAVLRKHNGEGPLKTYLATVARYFLNDYCDKLWGKWRPSMEAKRLGETAVLLERLITRDGLNLDVATNTLRHNFSVTESEEVLSDWASRFPRRVARPHADDNQGTDELTESKPDAESALVNGEHAQEMGAALRTMDQSLADLEPEERLIVKWVWLEGLKISDIARRFGYNQRPLYRRVEKIKARLRNAMEKAGVYEIPKK